ncbi:MAG TPA: thioredoxin domain-containing protein [Candidatus Saccharimonadales bacterium]|nr:thioredoxin domain-containing protein [Candidatus Saccharimonadales bacterium]
MNKKLLFAIIGILLVIGAAVMYVISQKETKTESHTTTKNTEVQTDTQPSSPNAVRGKYIDYTEADFASTRGVKMLFFHAPWCPQCRALDESIKASELPEGLTIFKVDYDSNQALRTKYGVTLQTTVVKTDEKGDKISSYVAYDEPTFQSVKQALLP